MTMAANRVSGAKAEKKKGKQRKANRGEDVENDEQDGIGDVHAQVELGLSELLKNLRSGSVKLTGDKATDVGGIITRVIGALEPILVKAVTTMSEAYYGEQAVSELDQVCCHGLGGVGGRGPGGGGSR